MKDRKKKSKHFLSVVMPAYREERSIQKSIETALKVLSQLQCDYELIVVVDGFLDKSYNIAKKMKSPYLTVLGYEINKGKGYAVRYGMARAKGDIIAFLDAGLDIEAVGLALFYNIFLWTDADIVIGSKLHPLSNVQYPLKRRILSIGYQVFIRVLFGLRVHETQTGIKMFRRRVLEDVLPRLLVKKFAFDVELLAVSYYLGYHKIFEAPVKINHTKWSAITSQGFRNVITRMLWDSCAVFYRLHILHYYDSGSRRQWRFDPDLNFRVNIG